MGLPRTSFSLELVVETCITCGCQYGVPSDMHAYRKRSHENIYCPSGHPMIYPGESDAEKNGRLLREEQERHKRTLARENAERIARETVERELTRHKTRSKNGVCPCCKRTFKQLAAHMKTKHPDYAK